MSKFRYTSPFRLSIQTGWLLLVGVLLLHPKPASAQLSGEFGLDFVTGIPQGAFAEEVDQLSFGLNVLAGMRAGRMPILVGFDGGFQIYGHETRFVPLSTTIPDITVRVNTSNNIGQAHLLFRLQPARGPVRPYVEGLFGLQYLFTETRVEDDNGNNEAVFSSTNYDDVAASTGAGAGADVLLGRARRSAIYLKFGVRYMQSGEVSYLREGDISREGGVVTFEPTRSDVRLMQMHLGVTVRV